MRIEYNLILIPNFQLVLNVIAIIPIYVIVPKNSITGNIDFGLPKLGSSNL